MIFLGTYIIFSAEKTREIIITMMYELSPQSSICSSISDHSSLLSKVKDSQVEVFKKPLHPPLRKKKKILDEETYVHVSS